MSDPPSGRSGSPDVQACPDAGCEEERPITIIGNVFFDGTLNNRSNVNTGPRYIETRESTFR